MNNIEKALIIIQGAMKNKKEYPKFASALGALADKEREDGRTKEADFIAHELLEALAMATMEDQ